MNCELNHVAHIYICNIEHWYKIQHNSSTKLYSSMSANRLTRNKHPPGLVEWENVITFSTLNLLQGKKSIIILDTFLFSTDINDVLTRFKNNYWKCTHINICPEKGAGLCYAVGLCLFCFDIQLSVLDKVAHSSNYDSLEAEVETGRWWVDISLGYVMRPIKREK